ncbi:FAD-dependent monooxygenase [Glaciecola sp. SC05]|uniref:FAD-dependent monooxygenase n=1 Tax=Glaciecola sp. SC05 TaxID=1987355 RepID=UPI003527E0D4
MPTKKSLDQSKAALMTHADVLIVGAGIVGQTLALALAQLTLDKPLKIVIVDSQSSLEVSGLHENVFSPRVSAISAASQKTFEKLRAWQHITRRQPYTHMQVWDADGFGKIDFSAQEIGLSTLGHIIENEQITQGLFYQGKTHKNITYLLGSAIEQMVHINGEYQLKLEDSSVVSTKLLVGADGANSFVRRQLGFNQTFWDYDHIAIVANVATECPHELSARQAFTPTGPLAFLPLADPYQCSIVWSQDTQAAKALLALPEDEFCKAMMVAIDVKLGACKLSTQRFSYPLRMRYAKQWVDESIALIGDAAHTIHPLAGQGANLGIADAVALADNIAQSIATNKPFNSKQQLRKYERFRKAEAQKVIATMEGFKQLFSGSNPVKKLVRNIGLSAANKLKPVKQFFIQQAEGK